MEIVGWSAAHWAEAFNFFEGVFWIVLGQLLIARAIMPNRCGRTTGAWAGLVCIVLAVSEFIEIRTGAWWQPWWLGVWKIACVLLLVKLQFRFRRELAVWKPKPEAEGDTA